jgi:penicillin amidase
MQRQKTECSNGALTQKSLGKAVEIYGKDWLESDKLMRTLGLYKHAQEIANHLDGETKSILEAYAEGVNTILRLISIT